MRITRTVAATFAAAALATGVAACANEEEAATNGAGAADTTVEETATETNTETAAPSSASESAAAGETVPVTTADGEEAMVPAGVKQAMDQYAEADWGEPMSVEEKQGGWVVAYDNGHYVTWNENTGGAPTWGEIANNWLTTVEAEQGLGFPTAPETELPDGSGWVQEFEHGTLEWTRDANGIFSADVKVNQ